MVEVLSLVCLIICTASLGASLYVNHDTRKRQRQCDEQEIRHMIEMSELRIRLLDKSVEVLETNFKLLRSEIENLRLDLKLLTSHFQMIALIDEIHHLRHRQCTCGSQLPAPSYIIIDQDGNVLQ